METCLTLNCFINRIRGNSATTTTTMVFIATDDVTTPNNSTLTTSSYKILLPVLLIIGILVIVAVGLILHRIVIRFVRKRWNSRGSNPDSTGDTRGTITTVSGDVESPPSYRQVLATMETGELPPSYYQVMTGVVNLGFEREENRIQTDGDVTTTTSSVPTAPVPSRVQSLTRSSRVRPSNEVTSTSSVVENIDDIIDSISVPSGLSETLERHSSLRTNSTKNKRGLLRHNLSQSIDCVAPKNQSLGGEVLPDDVIAHSTPV